uniref:helix-turn-helix domain-containing protein n=1 Tax=Clostridium perfringens TaxID=1502 RepID=UPI0032DB301F
EMRFIKNLVLERKKRGLSQRDLAYKSGLTQQAISSLEKCDRKPTLTNLIKYLLGLGIDINILFEK